MTFEEAVAMYSEYAKERGRWWSSKYPDLHQDIIATALFALCKACKKLPENNHKGYISRVITNEIVDMLERQYLIRIPRDEIKRRKDAGETLDTLPRANPTEQLHVPIAPTAYRVAVYNEILDRLNLTNEERCIIEKRLAGHTNVEIAEMLKTTERTIKRRVAEIRRRYERL